MSIITAPRHLDVEALAELLVQQAWVDAFEGDEFKEFCTALSVNLWHADVNRDKYFSED